MNIGQASRELNMPASTIRYYEKIGLVAPQPRVSGRRQFDNQALFNLRIVQLGQAAGFSIAEIKSLTALCHQQNNTLENWKTLARTKQIALKEQMQSLQKMDDMLTALVECDCSTYHSCVVSAITVQSLERS